MASSREELSNVSVVSAAFSGRRVAEPLKMTSAISLPRRLFDALLAQHPLDGVDDVRLARAVGTDDHGDAAGELEPSFVGKALEADEFQRLEHG